ncbi:MAG TPA: hypothetical protein VMD53_15805 [Rhizomicrobium sp.]|nr:hypothetical protein [Rhizomicrobium sp.]
MTQPLLGGLGNIDDNALDAPSGAYRAATLRAFDPKARKWSIWWLDGRYPDKLDVPMVGAFEDGVGTFHADDMFEGRAIKVRFLWSRIAPGVLPLGAGLLRRRRQDLGNELGDGLRARRLARYDGARLPGA